MRSSFAWPRRQITVPWGKLEAARIQQQMLCGLKNKAKLLKFISNDEIFYLCTSCIQHSTRAFYNDLELWNYLEIINTKRPKCCQHLLQQQKKAQLTPKTSNFKDLLGIPASPGYPKVNTKYQGHKDLAPFHFLIVFENPNGFKIRKLNSK